MKQHLLLILTIASVCPTLAQPTITSFSPASGVPGTSVTISGTNFDGTTLSNNTVFFGAAKATVTAATNTQLTVTAPSGATYQPITVTVAGLTAYSPLRFLITYTPAGPFNTCSFPRTDFALSSGSQPLGLAVGDFDGDGKVDIAVGGNAPTGPFVNVYLNQSVSGTIDQNAFAAPIVIPVIQNVASLTAGDLDGDGLLDIVATGNSVSPYPIAVFRNTSSIGSISFDGEVDYSLASAQPPANAAIADLDADGKPEIAVACNNSIVLLKNTSSAGGFNSSSFAAPVSFAASGAIGIAIADLNNDGLPDISVTNFGYVKASVYQSVTSPGVLNTDSFDAKVDYLVGSNAIGLALADFDNDQWLDIATANYGSTYVSLLHNSQTSGTITTSSFSAGGNLGIGFADPYKLTVADFDGNGMPDVAATSPYGAIFVWQNQSSPGSFTFPLPNVQIPAGSYPGDVLSADFDGDGRVDMVVNNQTGNSFSLFHNVTGNFLTPTITGFTPASGPNGTIVTMTGTNFDPVPANNAVTANGGSGGYPSFVLSSTPTSLQFLIPPGVSGTLTLANTVNCLAATAASPFTVVPPTCSSPRLYGTIDNSFTTTIGFGEVDAVGIQSTGKIVVCASDTEDPLSVNSTDYTGVLRFNADGSFDTGFTIQNVYTFVHQMVIQPDDKIIVANNVASTPVLARFNPDGTTDNSFTGPVFSIYTSLGPIALQADGKVVYSFNDGEGGDYWLYRVNSDGSDDINFNSNAPTQIIANVIVQQPDGKILVGSDQITRLNTDGSVDASFVGIFSNANINDLAVQPDGKIIAVGNITNYNGVYCNNIIRLNSDGSVDLSFLSNTGEGIDAGSYLYGLPTRVQVLSNGKILISGGFGGINNITKNNLLLLNSDGTLDCTFDTGAGTNSSINNLYDFAVQPDGKIVIGGTFSTYDGNTAEALVRLNYCIPPSAPPALGVSNCGPGSVTLSATGGSNGNYTWYDPTATVITGQNNATYITPTISSSTSYSVANAWPTNATCLSNSVAVGITINPIPSSPTPVGASNCGPGAVTLNASGTSNGNYIWYDPTQALLAGQTNSSYITPSLSTTTNYFVAITDGTCTSAMATVTATINALPAAPVAPNMSNCGPGSLTLTASGGSNGNYIWYDPTQTPIAGQINSTYITPTISTTSNYFVAITNGTCTSAMTTIAVTINSLPASPAASNMSNCGPGSLTLTASGGSAGNYIWYDPTQAVIAGQTNSSYTTPALSSASTYYVAITNGTCTSPMTSIAITINALPASPTVSNVSNCGPGSLTLSASGGSNGNYIWYDPTQAVIAGQTNSSFTTPSIATTTNYFVAITNGTCASTMTTVTATINALPAAPSSSNVNNCGPGSLTLTASGGSNGNYIWYDPTQSIISGQTNSTYVTPALSTTANYFVAITNGTCTSALTTVIATITAVPLAPTATGATGCPNTGITLSASGGANGTYVWYDPSQNIIAGQTNSTYTTPNLTVTTNYFVAISNGPCVGPLTSVTATVVTHGCFTPVISSQPLATQVGGIVTLNLVPLISTPNSTLDLSSLQITSPPSSGAKASISATGVLTIDYTGVSFSGTETISIRACDTDGDCTLQQFSIDVVGDIVVYNGISPTGNNPIFLLEYIDLIPETQKNTVQIFDRWQNLVWHGSNYDNSAIVFKGTSDGGSDLPSGVYFYKIDFASGRPTKNGFISLKR